MQELTKNQGYQVSSIILQNTVLSNTRAEDTAAI